MNLNKEQSLNIRGIAILIIVIHNFVDHLLRIHCNEMFYSQSTTDAFLEGIFTVKAGWYLVSFAGWAAVALFFFLSGYGLTRKYGSSSHGGFNNISFIKDHVIKLWKLLVPIYLLYIITHTVLFEHPFHIRVVLTTVTFLVNILSYGNNSFPIYPGAYWFFGAIMQFYLLFLVFRRLNTRWLCVLCLMFLAVHYFALYFTYEDTMTWIRHNFLGWGAPFVLGMIAARVPVQVNNNHRVTLAVCIVSLPLLACCLTIKFLSPFTELFTVSFFTSLTCLIGPFRVISFLGIISPSLFVVHPYVRMLFYNFFSSPNHPFAMMIIYLVPVIALGWIYHQMINVKWFYRKKRPV